MTSCSLIESVLNSWGTFGFIIYLVTFAVGAAIGIVLALILRKKIKLSKMSFILYIGTVGMIFGLIFFYLFNSLILVNPCIKSDYGVARPPINPYNYNALEGDPHFGWEKAIIPLSDNNALYVLRKRMGSFPAAPGDYYTKFVLQFGGKLIETEEQITGGIFDVYRLSQDSKTTSICLSPYINGGCYLFDLDNASYKGLATVNREDLDKNYLSGPPEYFNIEDAELIGKIEYIDSYTYTPRN